MSNRIQRCIAALLFCVFVRSACAQRIPVLEPKTYVSPDGHVELVVEPSTMYGQHGARYRMSRDGKEIWRGEHPFTLWEAAVCDDGTSCGYAYEFGHEGFPSQRRDGEDPGRGRFFIAIIGPDGKPRHVAEEQREWSRFLHDSPQPLACGLWIDTAQKTFYARVRNPDINEGGETWRAFDIGTGESLGAVAPPKRDADMRRLVSVAPIAQTPLVLMHWWHYSEKSKRNPGGVFALLDFSDRIKPKEVWRLERPGDYDFRHLDTKEDPYTSNRRQDEVMEHGLILRHDQPRQFDLHFVSEGQRVSFKVSGAEPRWTVREVARDAFELPRKSDGERSAIANLPEVSLNSLGTIKLGGAAAPSTQPVRDLFDADVDDRGRFGLIRYTDIDGTRGSLITLIDADGHAIIDAFVPGEEFKTDTAVYKRIAWLTGDRWLATSCEIGVEKTARAWLIDFKGGEAPRATRIEKFQSPEVSAIAPDGAGGFVTLGTNHYKYTSTHELSRFDRDGKRLWMVSSDRGNDSILFSPEDIAFDPTDGGQVWVLDNIRSELVAVKLADGTFRRRIKLEEALGEKPNYPSHLAVARDGTLVLYDFNAKAPVWKLKPDGTPIAQFKPRFEDQRPLESHDIVVDRHGAIWCRNRNVLARLSAEGVVNQLLGDRPDSDAGLSEYDDVIVAPDGLIYAAPRRSAVVRAFDSRGQLQRTFKGNPADAGNENDSRHLTVAGNGDVYLGINNRGYLHFRADGTRVGWEKPMFDTITECWSFLPKSQARWVRGYTQLWLVDESGKPAIEIKRRPDGKWLGNPDGLALAPDGSLAVLTRSAGRGRTPMALSFYSAAGAAIRTVELPPIGVRPTPAFDGVHAIVLGSSANLLIDVRDGSMRRFELNRPAASTTRPSTQSTSRPATSPTRAEAPYWRPTLSADGRELWLVDPDRGANILERYALPSSN